MQNQMGLESLIQRGKTPLYLNMVSLYQEAYDALSELPKASDQDAYEKLRLIGFQDRLKKIVLASMNIKITKVTLGKSAIPNMACLMETAPVPRNTIQAITLGTITAALERHYDNREANLTEDMTKPFASRFSLLIATSFFTLRNTDGTFYVTPEEAAATMLHELGHIDFYIRTYYRINKEMIDASDIITYVKAHPERKTILDLIDLISKSPFCDKTMQPVIDVVRKFFKEANDINDPVYIEALSTLAVMVTSETAGRNLIYLDKIIPTQYDKVKTINQRLDSERSADEFSARNGSYASLVSFLKKAHDLDTRQSSLFLRTQMWPAAAIVFGSLITFGSLFYIPAENVKNGYDPLLRRLKLIVETAKHAFHDEALPEDVMKDITAQIAQAESYIKEYESSANYKIRATFKAWKDNIATFGRIFASPFQDRLVDDYTRLQDATRSLSRHPLFYLARKKP